jgi:predicted transcriptional regulator
MVEPTVVRTKSREWAVQVAKRLHSACFPMDREKAKEILEGIRIDHTPIEKLLDDMRFPINDPNDLMDEIVAHTCLTACPPEEDWLPRVTYAMRQMTFPLSKEEAHAKLDKITIPGGNMAELIDHMTFPMATPADLLRALGDLTGDMPIRM